jgi:CRP/FNR family transcriptional regulator, cyclic AMP receptor protein
MSDPPTIDELFLRVVSEVELFRQLDRNEIAALLRQATKATYRAGETVYYEGELGQAMFVVMQGSFEVYRQSGGETVVLAHVLPGEHFGEIALIANRPRSGTVRAVTEAVALRLTKEALFAQPAIASRLMRNMARMLAVRLADADEDIILHRSRAREAEAKVQAAEAQATHSKGPQRRFFG